MYNHYVVGVWRVYRGGIGMVIVSDWAGSTSSCRACVFGSARFANSIEPHRHTFPRFLSIYVIAEVYRAISYASVATARYCKRGCRGLFLSSVHDQTTTERRFAQHCGNLTV
jgi:hypothetical protein